MRGWKDDVIEQQADTIAALTDTIAILTKERDGFRLVAIQSAIRLSDRYHEVERLKARLQAMREELRHTNVKVAA